MRNRQVEPLAGNRFGLLTAIALAQRGPTKWLCRCDCGVEKAIVRGSLMRGATVSCGCASRDLHRRAVTKHGHASREGKFSPEYESWKHMLSRCRLDPRYAGRGIVVCERWREFEAFLTDMGARPVGTTLDRINNDGNYQPENCRWATHAQQMRNTRRTRWITINGETRCSRDWATAFGISEDTASHRMRMGWDAEAAFKTPPGPSGRRRPKTAYVERESAGGGIRWEF
jgi:hypothetical protein